MKNTLVILGHPDPASLCGAMADAYCGGFSDKERLRRIDLSSLEFDPILHKGYSEIQELEPDLVAAQEAITWAGHLVFVYPIWWASMPALLKGFLDRIFLPGFAFKYREGSPWWDRYFEGKTARLITTMDAPKIYNWIKYWNSAHRMMKKATLEFAGVKPVKITSFDRVKFADDEKRVGWIDSVNELGRKGI